MDCSLQCTGSHRPTHGAARGDTVEDGTDDGLVLADTGSVGERTVTAIERRGKSVVISTIQARSFGRAKMRMAHVSVRLEVKQVAAQTGGSA